MTDKTIVHIDTDITFTTKYKKTIVYVNGEICAIFKDFPDGSKKIYIKMCGMCGHKYKGFRVDLKPGETFHANCANLKCNHTIY